VGLSQTGRAGSTIIAPGSDGPAAARGQGSATGTPDLQEQAPSSPVLPTTAPSLPQISLAPHAAEEPDAPAAIAETASVAGFRGLLLARPHAAPAEEWLTNLEYLQAAAGPPAATAESIEAALAVFEEQVSPAPLAAPEGSGLAADAAAFDSSLLERALREFLDQLAEAERTLGGWLAQPASWVLMGMAVATVGAESWYRRRGRGRNGLPLLAFGASGIGAGYCPDADGAAETV
jgi:hypothetical protein